jgi:nitrogen fixation/metabolism regulation signal transduction histidine kinase
LIREKLTGLKFGKPNEKIELNRRDEIGALVAAYNMMIDKLAMSAEQLARSERESAWREMAKQVAHEIKNPLTPMKLSVQHLKRAWDENAPDFDKRVERFTNTIVEQIDSLSSIASEFSDFAKMPEARAEAIDLREVIQNALELYRNDTQFDIRTRIPDTESILISADKKQMLRVLINLIKNAIQSFIPERRGLLSLSLEIKNQLIVISVQDNGHGISPDQQEKIFSPNFTTKSSGMGLGLAMVKTIIEDSGGHISFSSQEGIGTIFTISFPLSGN